jgi:spermidine synthase
MHPKPRFKELDYQQTPLGGVSLRRRTILALENREVYEILLGDEFLMSSLFTVVETELARLGLAAASAALPDRTGLDVVVGGLGLGYTARAALDNPALRSLVVIDYLEPVIDWHQRGLVPLGPELVADPRCRFVHGDFFDLATAPGKGFDPEEPGKKFHAVLLDIDHSPKHLLHERHAAFYRPEGLRRLAEQLHPGGVFALWSDDPPDDGFMNSLRDVFPVCESHVVSFHNPLQDRDSASTVYVAGKSRCE